MHILGIFKGRWYEDKLFKKLCINLPVVYLLVRLNVTAKGILTKLPPPQNHLFCLLSDSSYLSKADTKPRSNRKNSTLQIVYLCSYSRGHALSGSITYFQQNIANDIPRLLLANQQFELKMQVTVYFTAMAQIFTTCNIQSVKYVQRTPKFNCAFFFN